MTFIDFKVTCVVSVYVSNPELIELIIFGSIFGICTWPENKAHVLDTVLISAGYPVWNPEIYHNMVKDQCQSTDLHPKLSFDPLLDGYQTSYTGWLDGLFLLLFG